MFLWYCKLKGKKKPGYTPAFQNHAYLTAEFVRQVVRHFPESSESLIGLQHLSTLQLPWSIYWPFLCYSQQHLLLYLQLHYWWMYKKYSSPQLFRSSLPEGISWWGGLEFAIHYAYRQYSPYWCRWSRQAIDRM